MTERLHPASVEQLRQLAKLHGFADLMEALTKLAQAVATTELETLVDRYGLANLIAALAIVCEEKAEHIRENWQDRRTANPWATASHALDILETRVKQLGL